MRNSVIVAINHSFRRDVALQSDLHEHTPGRCGSYDIYKLLPKKINPLNTLGVDRTMLMFADVAFDISSKHFVKSRYGSNLSSFPKDLYNVYVPVFNIAEYLPTMDCLKKEYQMFDILRAIYLTDTFEKYKLDIDMVEYQLVLYKHGRGIPTDMLKQIIEKFPEKLI